MSWVIHNDDTGRYWSGSGWVKLKANALRFSNHYAAWETVDDIEPENENITVEHIRD